MNLHTARLWLRPTVAALLLAELQSPQALAEALAVQVPADWPPPLYDEGTVQQLLVLAQLAPGALQWPSYYLIEREAPQRSRGAGGRALVGIGGFKGPPDEQGTVEIGYSIVPSRQGQGLAKEAVEAWLAYAFGHAEVAHVAAHTLPEAAASMAVLRGTRFQQRGTPTEPNEPRALRFEISRWEYAHGRRPR